MNIPGLNGGILTTTGTASSHYSKNALGKFTDKNMLDSFIADRPQSYDRIIKLFTQKHLYSNDFMDLITGKADPFYIDEPNGQFEYELTKYSELPKIMVNLSDTIAKPGVDGSEFDLVFDKKVFVQNDIITAHRREQEVQLQVVSEPSIYQNYFRYTFRAIGPTMDSFVHQRFLSPGVQYMKVSNISGEYTENLSSLGLIDGKLKVVAEGLMEYGLEHTMTEYARLKKIKTDQFGRPLDITYYSVAGKNKDGNPFNVTVWEPTIASLMRMEMAKMKANLLLWGREGIARDEKGRPIKVYPGIWSQAHLGNIVYYNKGRFDMNIIRYTLDNLFYGRVKHSDRKAKVYTNTSGFRLVEKAIKEDYLAQGMTIQGNDFLKGKGGDNLNLGFQLGFTQYFSRETGNVEFIVLDELDEANTFLELGPDKRTPPVFIIIDISGGDKLPVRELKLKTRPNMLSGYIPGFTSASGTNNVLSATKNGSITWMMKDFTGSFLEDPTRVVIIKELPQY